MKPKSKLLSLLLAICLVVGLMPTAAFAAGTGKAIQLVDSGTAANIGGGQADNIYFGTYQQSSDGNSGYNIDPIKWRVLENANGQLFLLSDQNLDVFQYHTDWESVTWEKSTMRSWLNGYSASHNTGGSSGTDYTSDNFIGTAFSEKEQKAIAETEVVNDDNPNYGTERGNNTTDKIFLLSIAEANNGSYFADDASRISTNTAYVAGGGKIGSSGMYDVGVADYWWLRSPGSSANYAANVDLYGGVFSNGITVYFASIAVRPAFNLDLNSVLFTSAAAGGKSASGMDSGLAAVGDYDGNEWKLTLLDENRNFSISDAEISGSTVAFSYSGAQTGENEYISAVIENNGEITCYGRILQLDGTENGESGTASLTLPDGVTLSDTVKLCVFNEQYNGDYKTDYASKPLQITTIKYDPPEPVVPDPNPITIIQPANGTISTNFSNASAGATITVTATPNSGYELAYITVNGEKIEGTTFTMPDKAVTVSAVFIPATGGFSDVVPGAWYVDAVNYVVANGLMEGTSATTFEPEAQMTRAMFWTILARIDGETITGATWADDAREWAVANNVSDGTNPHSPLTREQLVTMLWRYLGEPSTTGTLAAYTDAASVSAWAKTAMAWAIEKGIITGITPTTLAPRSAATRAQCAAILMRQA